MPEAAEAAGATVRAATAERTAVLEAPVSGEAQETMARTAPRCRVSAVKVEAAAQAAAVAVTAALCAAVVRRGTPEIALVLVLAAGVWVLLSAAEGLTSVAALMEELAQLAGLERTVVEPVFKTVVLSILTKLTGEVCRSAGEGGLASAVEIAGTVLALAAALPLVRGVMELMAEMLV